MSAENDTSARRGKPASYAEFGRRVLSEAPQVTKAADPDIDIIRKRKFYQEADVEAAIDRVQYRLMAWEREANDNADDRDRLRKALERAYDEPLPRRGR